MAGNRVQYIIDLVVEDKQLRQKLSKIDWEKTLGNKGKGISEAFSKEGEAAAKYLKDAFRGLNIDWKSILGEKDLGRLEQQLAKVISISKGDIVKFSKLNDVSGIKNTIAYISELGSQLRELGSDFDAAQMARSLTSFMKVFAPISAKFEELSKEPKNMEIAFGKFFNSINSGANDAAKSSQKIIESYAKIETILGKKGSSSTALDKIVDRYKELKNFKLPDISSLSLDQLETEMEKLEERANNLSQKFIGKKNSSEYQLEKGKILLQRKQLYEAANKYDNFGYSKEAIKQQEDDIQKVLQTFEEAIEKLKKIVSSEDFVKSISDKLNKIRVKLVIDEESMSNLVSKLNSFIEDLSSGKGVDSAKIKIDYALVNNDGKNVSQNKLTDKDISGLSEMLDNEIQAIEKKVLELEKEQERARLTLKDTKKSTIYTARENQINALNAQKSHNQLLKASVANGDVPKELTSTLKSFEAMREVISAKQQQILSDTLEWRVKMIDAMKFAKGDIEFNFGIGKINSIGSSLMDELNAYFSANRIDININTEKLKKDIAEAVGQSGATLGGNGGNVNIDPKSLMSAIATGVQAAFTGKFTPVEDKQDDKSIEPKAPTTKKQKYVYLDPQNPYNAHMGKSFIDIAKYSQGKTKPAVALRNFFDMMGIDLKSIAEGENIMEALNSLAQVIEKGGDTLSDRFQSLINSVGKNTGLSAFGKDLSELLYTLNIGQTTVSQDVLRRNSIDVFNDFSDKQQLVSGLTKINYLDEDRLGDLSVEQLDGLIELSNKIANKIIETERSNLNLLEKEYESGEKTAKETEIYNRKKNELLAPANKYRNIANKLSELRGTRESVGDLSDDSGKQRLLDAISECRKELNGVYNEILDEYIEKFDMHVYIKGKHPVRVRGGKTGNSLSSVLRMTNGDMSKIEDVTLQSYPGEDNSLYRPAPDRTGILNRNATMSEFVLKDKTPKKWEDENESTRAAKRAADIEGILAEEEAKATNRAKVSAELEKQIAEKRKEKASLEKSLVKNKEKMSKLVGNDRRKIAGAQTRVENINKKIRTTSQDVNNAQNVVTDMKKAIDQAKQEKEDAEKLYQEVQYNNSKGRYSKFDKINEKISRYTEWARSPGKYRKEKELVGELEYTQTKSGVKTRLRGGIYETKFNTAARYKEEAFRNANETEYALAEADNKVSRIQKKIEKFGESPQLKQELNRAILEQKDLQRKLAEYQEEQNKNQAIIDDILRKRRGATNKDQRDLGKDIKERLGVLKAERVGYGVDPREEARNKVEEANKKLTEANTAYDEAYTALEKSKENYNKAVQKRKDLFKSDEYVKRSEKILGLSDRNHNISNRIVDIQESLENDLKLKETNDKEMQESSSEAMINRTEEMVKAIDSLINEQNNLEESLINRKKEVEDIDQFVAKSMKKSNHKTPKYDIKYSKKEQRQVDKYNEYNNRAKYLNWVANSNTEKDIFIPKNLTSDMKQAIESMTNSKNVLSLFGENEQDALKKLGLVKPIYKNKEFLNSEIQSRLDRNLNSKAKISPLLEEYYNRIIKDGLSGASEWLKEIIDSETKNIEAQKNKLKSFASSDRNKAMELKPAINSLDESLQQTYKDRVNTWVKSIEEKVSYLETDGLSKEDSMLATKELDELLKITKRAVSEYNKKYIDPYDDKIQRMQTILEKRRVELKKAIRDQNKYEEERIQKQIENIENAIRTYQGRKESDAILTPDQLKLIESRSGVSYANSINEDVRSAEKDLDKNITDINRYLYGDKDSEGRVNALLMRRADLLKQIQNATISGDSRREKNYKKELQEINDELNKYQEFEAMLNLKPLFSDDIKFANEFKDKLVEIFKLRDKADLAKFSGAPQSDLDAQYANIDAKVSSLNQLTYNKLKERQGGLLTQIGEASKNNRSTFLLEESLKEVNKQLIEYELNSRRIKQSGLGEENSLFGASEYVIEVYNKQIAKTIELEQALAIAKAKANDVTKDQAVIDATDALNKQNRDAKKAIARAIEDQVGQESVAGERYQALKYLKDNQDAYKNAYGQLYYIRGKIKRKEGYKEDVMSDNYQNSWMYKRHLNAKKEALTDEYVMSDGYKEDREKGFETALQKTYEEISKMIRPIVEKDFKASEDYDKIISSGKDKSAIQEAIDAGINSLIEERTNAIMYRLKESIRKNGMKIDPEKMKDAYSLFSKGGWSGIRSDIRSGFEDSSEYKNVISQLNEARKAAADKKKAEIDLLIDEIYNASPEDNNDLANEMQRHLTKANVENIEKEFNKVLKSVKKKTDTKDIQARLMSIARANGASGAEVSDLYNAVTENISNIRHGKRGEALSNIMRVFNTDERYALDSARKVLVGRLNRQKDRVDERVNQGKFYASSEVENSFRQKLDATLQKYMADRLEAFKVAMVDDETFAKEAGISTEIIQVFKNMMEEYFYNIAKNYKENLHVGVGDMPNAEALRQEIVDAIDREIETLKSYLPSVETNIANNEEYRRAAMKAGNIKPSEIADADILNQQEEFAAIIELEKEKQEEINSQISQLKEEGGQEDEIGKLNAALDTSKEYVNRLQMLINNRDNLIDIQHQIQADEKAQKELTLEQQKLWVTNALESAKAKLDSEDPTTKRIAEENVARYTELLNRLEAKVASQETEDESGNGIFNIMVNAFKEALGGKGGFALDSTGLATQATLEQIALAVERILVTIGGDVGTKVVTNPEMESKLMRMRELETKYGGKPGDRVANTGNINNQNNTRQNDSNNISKSNPIADEIIQRIKADVAKIKTNDLKQEIINTVKSIKDNIKNGTKGSQKDIEDRFKLHRLLSAYRDANKSNDEIPYYTNKKGKQQHSIPELAKYLGIGEDYKLRAFENDVKEWTQQDSSTKSSQQESKIKNTNKSVIDLSASLKQVEEIIKSVNSETKGTENSFSSIQSKMNEIGKSKVGGLKAFNEFKDALLKLQSASEGERSGLLSDTIEKAQKLVQIFSGYKNNVLADSNSWFGKKVQADATSLLGIVKQIFAIASDANKATKETKRNTKSVDTNSSNNSNVDNVSNSDGRIRYNEEDYKEYKNAERETKGYKPKVVRNEADDGRSIGLYDAIAKDETLLKILDAINNIAKNGVVTKTKKQAKAEENIRQKKTEADLIKDRVLTNRGAIEQLAAGKPNKLYDKYQKYVSDLEIAVTEANKANDKSKAAAMNKVKAAAERVSALGRNILNNTSEWEYKTAESSFIKKVPKTSKGKPLAVDRVYMENLAKQNAGDNKYTFSSFDGNTLTYQLENIKGEIREVTMEWNSFNREIAITSDKATGKFGELANEVNKLNNKFIEAQEIGYLNEQDKDLEAYINQLNEIDRLIDNGASFEEVNKARGKAISIGGFLDTKISKTKKLYNGSGVEDVAGQRRNIIDVFGSEEKFNENNFEIVERYKQEYQNLINIIRNLHNEAKALSDEEQEALKQQVVSVNNLGKKVLRQQKTVTGLIDDVNKSGSYEDKFGNEIQLGGIKEVSGKEASVDNLKQTMIDFAKNGLNHANMESIKFNKNTQTLTYNQRINKETVAAMAITYDEYSKSLYAANKGEKESLTGWKGFMKDIKGKGRSIFSYLTYTTSIYRLISVVRQGVTYVKEIDSAMTELRKVTDETEETYAKFLDTASETASKVGSTTKDVVSSTADWARLGYSIQEAAQLAESTQILMNVSEFTDISTATDSLISSIQAFKYTAEESMDVVDILNTIGNNYAISTADLATSLTKSSGSLVAANGTLEEAVALTATANTIIQDADVVGTALKTKNCLYVQKCA